MIFECCLEPRKHHLAVYEKFISQKYKRAATYVEREIANGYIPFPPVVPQPMSASASTEEDVGVMEYKRATTMIHAES